MNWDDQQEAPPALINFKGRANGVLLRGCSFITVSNISLQGDGFSEINSPQDKMRCGVLIQNWKGEKVESILLQKLQITDVFFENPGFKRGQNEVKTANGTQRYGWGIRVMNTDEAVLISHINIIDCSVKNVSHTAIKLTGLGQNIQQVTVEKNVIIKPGGPGIQMSGVRDVYVRNNDVSYTGSNDDSRKWGRGSGLWTWGSSHVLIEQNKFFHANGPGDSAGAHIDFNCDNIILQHNISGYNAGGFCEILGNTYNCTYRYNLSINDGFRQKGENGAFQEGKILWLSGYQGRRKSRKGPVNFYCYNNTIYCDSSIVAKIAIDNTCQGVLIANNIFHLAGGTQTVLGDQYKPDTKNDQLAEGVLFTNNLFLNLTSWPTDGYFQDSSPRFGDPVFTNPGGHLPGDYSPTLQDLTAKQGIQITPLPQDSIGLFKEITTDLLGRKITNPPSIGAVEVARF